MREPKKNKPNLLYDLTIGTPQEGPLVLRNHHTALTGQVRPSQSHRSHGFGHPDEYG